MPAGLRLVVIFQDRRHAGLALAQIIRYECDEWLVEGDAIVLGLPRGGVPVAFEVARELHLPMDVFVVRKLGVPGQDELAMGAVAGGDILVTQPEILRAYRISQETVDAVAARERIEIERRDTAYRSGRAPALLQGRTLILVDDGLATGATMRAAAHALRPLARRTIVAVPVAAPATREEISREVDRVVCIETPEPFHAVGEFYRNFEQTTDDEVRVLLAQARAVLPDTWCSSRALP
jgi:putative phosphoribosyl transferase